MAIAACGDHCILATRTDDGSGTFGLILCNSIGTAVDSKLTNESWNSLQPKILPLF